MKAEIVPVAEAEIRWTLDPIGRLEEIDPLGLTGDELLPHIVELREELRAVRLVLSVALGTIRDMEKKRTGQQVR